MSKATLVAVLLLAWVGHAAAQPAQPAHPDPQADAGTAQPPAFDATGGEAAAATESPAPPPPAEPAGPSPSPDDETDEPAAAQDPGPPPAPEGAAMDAELADFLAAGTETTATAPSLDSETLSLYGFADFTYGKIIGEGITQALRPFSSFYVGNLNVYLDANLAPDWRSLMEVRFTYLPHGSFSDSGELIEVQGQDYADNLGSVRLGMIEIERAWAEYSPTAWLAIRAGQWLTPYGIWNVDHGTPTLIAIQKPYLVSSAVLPERQTGVMLRGTLPISDSNELHYHLTVSNGRGAIDSYRDLDANKALGGRLELRHMGAARIQLGASGYTGRYTESRLDVDVGADVDINLSPAVRYDEAALAGDLRVNWLGLDLVAEAIIGEVVYVDGKRENAVRGLSPYKQADLTRGGAYFILGYTIDSLRLMPFGGFDYIQDPLQIGTANFTRAGLRFTPAPTVTLKFEWMHLVESRGAISLEEFDSYRLQLAWAFR